MASDEKKEKAALSDGVELGQPSEGSVTLVERADLESKGQTTKRPLLGFIDSDGAYIRPSRFQTVEDSGENDEIQYRTMHWWAAGALMLAETVSLGVLSLPSVFAEVGMVAGCFLVVSFGALATCLFKMAYPGVNNMADAGEVMAGPWGRELLGAAQILFLVFICASHVLTGLIAFDTISNHATCAIVWAVLTMVVCAVLTLPRTFSGIKYLAVVSFISIMAAVLITMIGVGVAGHTGTVSVTVDNPAFSKAFLSVTNIVFAYAGHVAFLQFISELRRPRDFTKALIALQISDTTIYLVVGIVVYAYVGADAASPALGNVGFTLSRIAYGIALPTIIVAGVINGSVAAKLVMYRIFVRHGETPSRHYTSNTVYGWTIWILILATIWALAFVIAEVIPFFNDLLSVISSLFAAWFTYGISGIFYLFFTPRHAWFETRARSALTVFNMWLILFGLFIMVGGLYSSIKAIADGYSSGEFGHPFGCQAPKS